MQRKHCLIKVQRALRATSLVCILVGCAAIMRSMWLFLVIRNGAEYLGCSLFPSMWTDLVLHIPHKAHALLAAWFMRNADEIQTIVSTTQIDINQTIFYSSLHSHSEPWILILGLDKPWYSPGLVTLFPWQCKVWNWWWNFLNLYYLAVIIVYSIAACCNRTLLEVWLQGRLPSRETHLKTTNPDCL